MGDQLKKFIEENKSSFNDKNPPDKLWSSIEKKTFPSGRSFNLWRAAAVIFFLSTAGLVYQNYFNDVVSQNELTELESYYFTQIDYKQSLINEQVLGTNSGDIASAEEELQKLDAMYRVLKEEWNKKPSKKVLEALTLNLIVRMNILNRQLNSLTEGEASSMRSS